MPTMKVRQLAKILNELISKGCGSYELSIEYPILRTNETSTCSIVDSPPIIRDEFKEVFFPISGL